MESRRPPATDIAMPPFNFNLRLHKTNRGGGLQGHADSSDNRIDTPTLKRR